MMRQFNIEEGNRLIVEFMDCHRDEEVVIVGLLSYTYDQLRYNIDWNWLMPVFFKFRKMDVAYEITSKGIRIYDHLDFDCEWECSSEVDEHGYVHGDIIYDAWRAAVSYIIYYNEQLKKQQ